VHLQHLVQNSFGLGDAVHHRIEQQGLEGRTAVPVDPRLDQAVNNCDLRAAHGSDRLRQRTDVDAVHATGVHGSWDFDDGPVRQIRDEAIVRHVDCQFVLMRVA